MGSIFSRNKSSPEVKHFKQVLSDFKRILELWTEYEKLPKPGSAYSFVNKWKRHKKTINELDKIYASQKGCSNATVDRSIIRDRYVPPRSVWESHKKRMVREFLDRLKTAFVPQKVVREIEGIHYTVSLKYVVENELIPLAAYINPHRHHCKRDETFYTKGPFGEGVGGKGDSFSDFFRQELKTIVRPAEPIPVEPAVADSPDSWANAEDNSVGDNSCQVPTNIRESCARRLAPLSADPASPGRSPLLFIVPVLVFLLLMLLRRRFRARLAPKRALVRHGSRVLREEEAIEPRADRV